MAFTIDGTNGLTFNNATTQASSSKVLQVVNGVYSTTTSTTSTSFVTTGLTATITPLFSTSKILVMFCLGDQATNTASSGISTALYKNNTTQLGIFGSNQLYGAIGGGFAIGASQSVVWIDSPATTSATIYTAYFLSKNGNSVTMMRDNSQGSIILMEIAA